MAAGVCASGALIVAIAALVRDKPLHAADLLVIPAIPVLVAGQLWVLALMGNRTPRVVGNSRGRTAANLANQMNPRRLFFGALPDWAAYSLLGVAFLGWFLAMTCIGGISSGGPTSPTAGCPYRLNDHGTYTCVSERSYNHAGASTQRFASGILLGFFTVHTGVALSELRRRRPPR